MSLEYRELATMKNQHTPGPWAADIRLAQAIIVDTHGHAVADIARHEFSVTEQSYSDQRIEANANLIAAAPELLQIAKDYVLLCQLHDLEGAVLDSARTAIAKAEGVK